MRGLELLQTQARSPVNRKLEFSITITVVGRPGRLHSSYYIEIKEFFREMGNKGPTIRGDLAVCECRGTEHQRDPAF